MGQKLSNVTKSPSKCRVVAVPDVLEVKAPPDVNIRVGSDIYNAHKKILGDSCAYFDVMFNSGFTEGRLECVEIKEIDAEAFASILKHIYGGKVDIAEKNVETILQIANMVGLLGLQVDCEKFIVENIVKKNYIELYEYGLRLYLPVLKAGIIAHMKSNIKTFITSETFNLLPERMVFELLRSVDQINLDFNPLLTAIRWLRYDFKTRYVHLHKLLELVVPFFSITDVENQLRSFKEPMDGVMLSSKIKKLLVDTYKEVYENYYIKLFDKFMLIEIEKPHPAIGVCNINLNYFDPDTNEWLLYKEIVAKTLTTGSPNMVGMVISNDKFYGLLDGTLLIYDLKEKCWQQIPGFPKILAHASIFPTQNRLIVTGDNWFKFRGLRCVASAVMSCYWCNIETQSQKWINGQEYLNLPPNCDFKKDPRFSEMCSSSCCQLLYKYHGQHFSNFYSPAYSYILSMEGQVFEIRGDQPVIYKHEYKDDQINKEQIISLCQPKTDSSISDIVCLDDSFVFCVLYEDLKDTQLGHCKLVQFFPKEERIATLGSVATHTRFNHPVYLVSPQLKCQAEEESLQKGFLPNMDS